MGSVNRDQKLDETVWSNPHFIAQYGPLHDNTVLMYFADSPWCEPTSNNKTIMNQALYNPALASVVATREAFEGRLKSMSGLEHIVSEAPAETGPGQGTGVWIIRKQTRKKRGPGQEEELTLHALYYIVGQNVYPAPSLMDIMSSKLAMISHHLGDVFEAANSIQRWTPASGHAHATPTIPRAGALEPKEPTSMLDSQPSISRAIEPWAPYSKLSINKTELDSRLAEESFAIHTAFGGDYMDEIPITGKPGDFHFASTGRSDKLSITVPQVSAVKAPVLVPLNTAKSAESPSLKDVKKTKSPKPGSAKAKDRRKSKGGNAMAVGTPTPS